MQQKKLATLNMTLASSGVVVDGFKLKNVRKWEGEYPYFGVHCGERSRGLPIYPPHQLLFIRSKLDRPG
jgi:hypothetical protein